MRWGERVSTFPSLLLFSKFRFLSTPFFPSRFLLILTSLPVPPSLPSLPPSFPRTESRPQRKTVRPTEGREEKGKQGENEEVKESEFVHQYRRRKSASQTQKEKNEDDNDKTRKKAGRLGGVVVEVLESQEKGQKNACVTSALLSCC